MDFSEFLLKVIHGRFIIVLVLKYFKAFYLDFFTLHRKLGFSSIQNLLALRDSVVQIGYRVTTCFRPTGSLSPCGDHLANSPQPRVLY